MDYKASCPNCNKRMSRWHIFGEPTIYHRCRGCGVRFRPTLAGNLAIIGFLVLAAILFALVRMRVLSPLAALVLLMVKLVIMVWIAPYITPVKVKQDDKTKQDENDES